ncbi:MAG: radical SAM protein, partial [Anaerolineae bacterium]
LLISGGADERGRVPLLPYGEALAQLASMGLRVIVHCGLPDRSTARMLKEARIEQALLDVVGDAATCRTVLGLERTPADYWGALELLRAEGLSVAPHIVAGLHGGRMRGECEALEMVAAVGVQRLVIVVFTPRTGTPLALCQPPGVEEVARLLAAARLRLPTTPISLGCMRPAGAYKAALDELAVRAGVNAIAYPAESVAAEAATLGLGCVYGSLCCCLDELTYPQTCASRTTAVQ